MNSVCRRRSVCSKCAPKSSVNSVSSVREKNVLCERKNSPRQFSNVLFLTDNTDEQNTQYSTETLSQPISQNLTATFSYNVLWILYAEGVLWDRNSAQMSSVLSVSSVREKPPQRFSSVLSHMEGAFSFSQNYTEEQNTQRATETLSQPISQNLTATFSYNVLWILYAEGVLWDRNSAQMSSVLSVSSVREKPPQRFSSVLSHMEGAFSFSQKNTEEQNTQRPTETLSQPISQNLTSTFSWNVLWYLYAGGVLWDRNSAQKCSVKSVSSVRDKTPHELNCALKRSVKSVSSVREKTPHELNSALKCSVKSVSSVREKTPQREKKLSIPFACIPTRSVKRLYIQPSKLSSKWEGGVSFNGVHNSQ